MAKQTLGMSISTKQVQKTIITPQLKQSLQILQMPIVDLISEVQSALEENPVLETGDTDFDFDEVEGEYGNELGTDTPTLGDAEVNADGSNDTMSEMVDKMMSDEWDDYMANFANIKYNPSDTEGIDLDKLNGASETLYEHLHKQLLQVRLPVENDDTGAKRRRLNDFEYFIADYIIGNLDDTGLFTDEITEICELLNCEEDKFREILKIIQTFEPAGIASTNISECLVTQLHDLDVKKAHIELAEYILTNHQKDLINGKIQEIANKVKRPVTTIETVLGLLRKTNPNPASKFNNERTFVTPDVFIVKNGEKFEVIINDSDIPAIRLNAYYTKIMRGEIDADTKNFLTEKCKNAIWLINSLDKRKSAISKIMTSIVEIQHSFFLDGYKSLKPLRLSDIAQLTNLNESTVSRAISGKYAMTPRGLIDIKSFFSKGFDYEDPDLGTISSTTIRELIKEIVSSEDTTKPYSDQAISTMLADKNIKIARRTIAKYREEMNIGTRFQRMRIKTN